MLSSFDPNTQAIVFKIDGKEYGFQSGRDYSSVDDLKTAIYDYLAHLSGKPKPFRWTNTAEDILTRALRALNALDEISWNRWEVSNSES